MAHQSVQGPNHLATTTRLNSRASRVAPRASLTLLGTDLGSLRWRNYYKSTKTSQKKSEERRLRVQGFFNLFLPSLDTSPSTLLQSCGVSELFMCRSATSLMLIHVALLPCLLLLSFFVNLIYRCLYFDGLFALYKQPRVFGIMTHILKELPRPRAPPTAI